MKVKFTKVVDGVLKGPDGKVVDLTPTKGSADAAGYDLRAAEQMTIYPHLKATIRTGIAIQVPKGYYGAVVSRSGIAKKHSVFVLNSPGTVDADYRGEVMVMLQNLGGTSFEVQPGDRIAQLVILKHEEAEFELGELDATARGQGGMGSTGTR